MLTDNEILRSVVQTHFPSDCSVVGDSVLTQLLQMDNPLAVTPTRLQGGYDFDTTEALKVVAAAIALGRELLNLRQSKTRKTDTLGSAEEMAASVARALPSSVPSDVKIRILELAIEIIEAEKQSNASEK
jgi:hypothetical protein